MPSWSSLVAFAAMSFVLVVIPGPSVLFVIGRALALGRRAALLTVAGNAAGFTVQIGLVAVGLGAVVARSVAVLTVVKWVGAAYLVWLGVQAIRHRRDATGEVPTTPVPVRSILTEGFVVGVSNPKTVVFFAAILPQFVVGDGAPAGVQMMVLGLVFATIALVCDSGWGLAAGTARTWFARSPRRAEVVRASGGAAIVGLGVSLALSGRPRPS